VPVSPWGSVKAENPGLCSDRLPSVPTRPFVWEEAAQPLGNRSGDGGGSGTFQRLCIEVSPRLGHSSLPRAGHQMHQVVNGSGSSLKAVLHMLAEERTGPTEILALPFPSSEEVNLERLSVPLQRG
jgi:hypothetical protein